MHYSLSNALGRPYVSGLDADAKAYIDAVVAAGATVTGTQRNAINDFVAAEKDASRWTGLKRFYLPVWGVAAANAICMKSLTSGTFNGGVTHASGFVQGNGTTGWFDFGSNPATLGLGQDDHYIFALSYELTQTADWDCLIGCMGGGLLAIDAVYGSPNSTTNFYSANNGASRVESGNSVTGIYSLSRTGSAGANVINSIRRTSGRTTATGSASISLPTSNLAAMAINNGGTPADISIGKMGAYGAGIGMSDSDDSAFTLNLKTLWETVTGNLLP